MPVAVAVGELDGRPVVVSTGSADDEMVRVWELATGEPVSEHTSHHGFVRAVAVGELEGRPVVVSGGVNVPVRVWELASGEPVSEHTSHVYGVRAVAVGELDGRPVVIGASSASDGNVRVWELATGEPVSEHTSHHGFVRAVAVGELDGRPVVVSGGIVDGTVRVWELPSRQVHTIEIGAPIQAIVWASSSRILVVTAAGFALLQMREKN